MAGASNAIPTWYLVFQMSMTAMEQEKSFREKVKEKIHFISWETM